MHTDRYDNLKNRTQDFALSVVRLVEGLPRNQTCAVMGRQLLRCSTSVGANYRSSCRAKSTPDFIAKMTIVEEEADECIYWLELLCKSGHLSPDLARAPMEEADQIVAIVVASIRTARQNSKK